MSYSVLLTQLVTQVSCTSSILHFYIASLHSQIYAFSHASDLMRIRDIKQCLWATMLSPILHLPTTQANHLQLVLSYVVCATIKNCEILSHHAYSQITRLAHNKYENSRITFSHIQTLLHATSKYSYFRSHLPLTSHRSTSFIKVFQLTPDSFWKSCDRSALGDIITPVVQYMQDW